MRLRHALPLALLLLSACGGGGGGSTAAAPVPTPKLGYTDPVSSGYRLLRNAGLSTDGHLVLDLVGPATGKGRGLSFAFTVDATKAQWAKASASDADLVTTPVLELGAAPRIAKVRQAGGLLEVAFAQKGAGVSAKPLAGALARVALDLKPGAAGTVSLSAGPAQVLPESGAPADIAVVLGPIVIQ